MSETVLRWIFDALIMAMVAVLGYIMSRVNKIDKDLDEHRMNDRRHVTNGMSRDTLQICMKRLEEKIDGVRTALDNHISSEEAWRTRLEEQIERRLSR